MRQTIIFLTGIWLALVLVLLGYMALSLYGISQIIMFIFIMLISFGWGNVWADWAREWSK